MEVDTIQYDTDYRTTMIDSISICDVGDTSKLSLSIRGYQGMGAKHARYDISKGTYSEPSFYDLQR